jgi:nitric oxide reductase subunit B
MHTLPQINLYTHGTQWTSSHAHLAFFGAYATINIAMFYMALQKWRGNVYMSGDMPNNGRKWKWSLGLLCIGVLGMTMALLIAGYEQSFVERALGGSTWAAYFEAQRGIWFVQSMFWRQIFGVVTAVGLVVLIWDMATIGRHETRSMVVPADHAEAAA